MYLKLIIVFLTFFVAVASTHPSSAETNMLFILDGSGSMWGQVDGVAKIQTAKETLGILLKDLPPDSMLGLMAYGHRSEGDCKDVEVVSGIGETDAATLTTKINGISPQGKTPISFSLESALPVFESLKGKNNHIILISDGIETCGGDPCASSKMLADAGINVKVHVVGFDVTGDAKKQLQCIADKGGGKYFDASSADAFKAAVEEVKQVAEAIPEPVKEPEQYFFDDFDGDELAEHWEVINPDPDAFIVEDGELMMINASAASFAGDNITNLFRLNKDLPDGDWVAIVKLDIDFQSEVERVFFGLYDDKENYLVNVLSTASGGCAPGASYRFHLNMTPTKALKGKVTQNSKEVWSIERCGKGSFNELMAKGLPFLIRLEKRGREYTSAIKLEGTEEPAWIELPGLKLLRAKGNLSIGLFQAGNRQGETTVKIDWVKIETY